MALPRREITGLIEESMLFRSLSTEARDAIVAIAVHRPFAPGDLIIEEGCKVEGLGLVISGSLRVSTSSLPGDSLELKILRSGAYFGEVGFLSNKPATATLTGDTEGAVLVFPSSDLAKVIVPFPQVKAVLERLALRRAEDTIEKTLKRLQGD